MLRHDAWVSFRSPSLSEVVAALHVEQIDDETFVAAQLDNSVHHIVGGHIAGQALMAASRTAPERTPHSAHVYYLRAGDARLPVDFHVERARDGGTLSTRKVTARQQGEVLLEALASFSTDVEDAGHQVAMPDVPDPETLPPVQEQLRDYAEEYGGHWVRPQPFDLRYVDLPPRLAMEQPGPSPRIRMWWRPTESVPDDHAGDGVGDERVGARGDVLRTDRPRAVVPPPHRPVRLGVVGPGLAKWCSRSGPGQRDDVQPVRPTRLHRHPGAVLRQGQADELSITASTW